jgi:hypothetical protein
MRRMLVSACLLAALLPCVPAGAQGAPAAGHGADPVSVDRGPEAAAPSGGPAGKPLAGGPRLRTASAEASSRLPTSWCGDERSSDDREHELPNGEFRYHAVYAYPADGESHLRAHVDAIQTDAFQASALLESQYGRALRFDMGTSCGQQYLDISAVRLPQTSAELAQLSNRPEATMDAVIDGLNAAGFEALSTRERSRSRGELTTNYIVWLDGPAPAGACGQATSYDDPTRDPANLNNLGGKVAVVFPDGDGGFCSSNTVRHEIGHNLGALQPSAPHAFDGAHCDDAYEDTMCYSTAPMRANGSRGLYFDYGNDDYWDPPAGAPLGWWTVNLSRFLCPDTTCNVPVQPAPPPAAPEGGSEGAGELSQPTVATPAPPKLVLVSRRRGRRWRLSVRARGTGRAVLSVRCRRRRGGHVRKVLSRRLVLPRSVRARVTCRSRPVATLRSPAGAAKVRAPRRGRASAVASPRGSA